MRDPAAALHRGRLDEHDAGPALCEFAEVHEVPVGDVAVLRGILAHRRHHDAVARLDAAQPDAVEEHQLCAAILVLFPLPFFSVIAVAEPLPFHCSSLIFSPRKLSSIVTSSGSLRKIWKSGGFASGKAR
jgi:hypothetical protein